MARGRFLSACLAVILTLPAMVLLAAPTAADHPAPQVLLVVIDGPRHDMAHDPDGPLGPLYEVPGAAVASNAWTVGRPKTLPGHAALLTGQRNDVSNLGTEAPSGQSIWQAANRTHGWGPDQMRMVHTNPKLDVLAPDPYVANVRLPGDTTIPRLVAQIDTELDRPETRLVVANFLSPDTTGHRGDWEAHGDALSTIAEGLAPIIEQEVEDGTLVIVTADHARSCDDPTGHGGWGPWASADACDANVPLLLYGWHTDPGAQTAACITHADVTALVNMATGAWTNGTTGMAPLPLLDIDARFTSSGCPPTVSVMPVVPPVLALGLTMGASAGFKRHGLSHKRL